MMMNISKRELQSNPKTFLIDSIFSCRRFFAEPKIKENENVQQSCQNKTNLAEKLFLFHPQRQAILFLMHKAKEYILIHFLFKKVKSYNR